MTPEEYETVSKADLEEAERHIEWFLNMVRPLLISFSVHFKKHGREEAQQPHRHTPYHTGPGEIVCKECGKPCGAVSFLCGL